jgi:hypothetical protein
MESAPKSSNDGDNTVNLKNLGRRTIGINDIMHSAAIAGANWNGINRLVGIHLAKGCPVAPSWRSFPSMWPT